MNILELHDIHLSQSEQKEVSAMTTRFHKATYETINTIADHDYLA